MAQVEINTKINYLVTWFRDTKNIHLNVQAEGKMLDGTTIFDGNLYEYYANPDRTNAVQYIENNKLEWDS